ncbi:MAG: hypothetical protein HC893_08665 [Chloroflexaceae bacterium]|nr:hypothetical protein [Chloroflexaceae bacterium]
MESYRTALTLFLRWLDREGRATVGALTLDDLLKDRIARSRLIGNPPTRHWPVHAAAIGFPSRSRQKRSSRSARSCANA